MFFFRWISLLTARLSKFHDPAWAKAFFFLFFFFFFKFLCHFFLTLLGSDIEWRGVKYKCAAIKTFWCVCVCCNRVVKPVGGKVILALRQGKNLSAGLSTSTTGPVLTSPTPCSPLPCSVDFICLFLCFHFSLNVGFPSWGFSLFCHQHVFKFPFPLYFILHSSLLPRDLPCMKLFFLFPCFKAIFVVFQRITESRSPGNKVSAGHWNETTEQ